MLGLTDILEIIKAVLKFPEVVLSFVKLIQKTPQENHTDLIKIMAQEAEKYEDTGRPTWN